MWLPKTYKTAEEAQSVGIDTHNVSEQDRQEIIRQRVRHDITEGESMKKTDGDRDTSSYWSFVLS